MAIHQRPLGVTTIHHSDRGSQYCCWAYIKRLEKAKIAPSMTQSGDPRENAIAERINGILKSEFLQKQYETLAEVVALLPRVISIYNVERPHLSLDLLTPSEVHQQEGPQKRRWRRYPFKSRNPDKVQTVPSTPSASETPV